jgi:hypothetical protein
MIVDNLGVNNQLSTPPKSNKASIIACISFFLLLCTWLAVPFGATGDMDFHLTSIWCALGEKDGLCEGIDRTNNTAEVPYMFQMCDSRNIDFWPYCEFENAHPETQRLRMAPPTNLSVYYRIAHFFVDQDIHSSVLKIRIFNSLISSLVLYLLLSITTRRIRFAALAGFTFSIIPFGLQHFSGATTRGWAVLAVMTSWAFLTSYLQTPKSEIRLRTMQFAAYGLTVLLALFSRIDAMIIVLITSLVVIVNQIVRTVRIGKKQLLIGGFCAVFIVGFSQYLPGIRIYATFAVPQEFGIAQYSLFQLVHIPEYFADWWNYGIGQGGSGPGIVGLVGVLLFILNLGFALQKSDLRQRMLFIGFSVLIFTLLAKSSSVIGSLVPLTAFYTLGLAVPWLGTTITNSQNKLQFMSTTGNRRTAIWLLSFSHAVFFYDMLEFYTKRGVNVGYFETISLNNVWWWDVWVGPNTVFLAGAALFPLFLSTLWRSIPLDFPEK